MTSLIIPKCPTKFVVENIRFFEVRTYLGVFVGVFGDENVAWGVENDANIKLEIELDFNQKQHDAKEQFFSAKLTLDDGTVLRRYAALISGNWSETFDSLRALAASLAVEEPEESMSPRI